MSRTDYPAGQPPQLLPLQRITTEPPIERHVLEAKLAELEADERLTKYRTASCFTNVVLAVGQQYGRAQIDLLRQLLQLPPFNYPKGDPL